MKRSIRVAIVYILLLITNCLPIQAQQELRTVYGKVLNASEGGKKARPFPIAEKVHIYAFSTVEAAKDALKKRNSNGEIAPLASDTYVIAGADGYYEIPVAENGALIFHVTGYALEEVRGRECIDYNFDSCCPPFYSTVQESKASPFPKYKLSGTFPSRISFTQGIVPLPQMYTHPNMRIIIQPYYVDCATEDTIISLSPKIMQGKRFKVKGDPNRIFFPEHRQSWEKHIDHRRYLYENDTDIWVQDTIRVPDIRRTYSMVYRMTVEKQKKILFKKDLKYTSCKLRRPLAFLDFSVIDSFETDKDSSAVRLWQYIHRRNAGDAQNTADTLPDTEHYRMLKAFAYTLCGYYDFTKAADIRDHQLRKDIFETVKETSTLNRVVMCMAIGNALYDTKAQEALRLLPQEDALTYYFKAILAWRSDIYRTEFEFAANNLLEAFKRDGKFIKIAAQDGEIFEELYEYVMRLYEQDK